MLERGASGNDLLRFAMQGDMEGGSDVQCCSSDQFLLEMVKRNRKKRSNQMKKKKSVV